MVAIYKPTHTVQQLLSKDWHCQTRHTLSAYIQVISETTPFVVVEL